MKSRRILSLILVLCTVLSLVLAGCGSTTESTTDTSASTESTETTTEESTEATSEETTAEETTEELSYEELSSQIYTEQLGDFYDAYMEACDEVDNISMRYALMAVAEAKLLETGTFLPIQTNGGSWQITRMAYRTGDYALWGADSDRYHGYVVTEEFISNDDWQALKDLWNELKGTGTYRDEAKAYLEDAGYTISDELALTYSDDPQVWDILATSRSADSDCVVDTICGLVEYDAENTMQPALAESWEVSDDGLTYTFHIRQGVKWVDSQGREVGEVTADDFVAGMQHMMDAQGGLEYLIEGVIVNASEYISGEITDFTQVGVEATDDYTLVYTLESPTPYFMTMLGYSVFLPMNRSYYESLGGTFGADYATSGSGSYGLDPDSIAYCGPYVISNYTANSAIVYTYNETYWDPDSVNVHSFSFLYNDGTDESKYWTDLTAGTIDSLSLTSSRQEMAKADGLFDDYAHTTDTGSYTYPGFLNVNRAAYENFNDGAVASPKTDEQKELAYAALQNVHFRRALLCSIDRTSYLAQSKGDDLAAVALRNTYTPGTFVSLEEDVTISINGTDTTFAAGTYYGEIVQAQLNADEVGLTVWDAENLTSDGFDGWYNPEYAASELEIAIEELAAEGYTIDANNPVYIDNPVFTSNETSANMGQVIKQSVENALGGLVIVNSVECTSTDELYYAGYWVDAGYENNYDLYDHSGWGPDYGDPKTYLDTMLPDYSGYMTKCLGIF